MRQSGAARISAAGYADAAAGADDVIITRGAVRRATRNA